MLRSAQLAIRATAFLVVVPLRIPPAGLIPIEIVTGAVESVTVLPKESCTVTVGAPGIAAPAEAFPG